MADIRPRRGLHSRPTHLAHARDLPIVPDAEKASAAVFGPAPAPSPPTVSPEPPAAPPEPAVRKAPKVKARAAQKVPKAGEGANRITERQRDNATLIRKTMRIPKPIADALSKYCVENRWTEAAIVEQALEEFLKAKGMKLDSGD